MSRDLTCLSMGTCTTLEMTKKNFSEMNAWETKESGGN